MLLHVTAAGFSPSRALARVFALALALAPLVLGAAACGGAQCPSVATPARSTPAPYAGAYNIEAIRNGDGETIDVAQRLSSAPGSLGARMAWVFEGETLRMQILAVTRVEPGSIVASAHELYEVCDVSLRVGVTWDGDAMIVPTPAGASGREHVLAFEDGADEEWSDVGSEWTDTSDSCDVSIGRMRVVFHVTDAGLTDSGRPRELTAESVREDGSVIETYTLVAATANEDLDIEEEVDRLRGE